MYSSLYIHRPLLNAAEVVDWYRAQGLTQTLLPDDMHVTVCYSLQPLNWLRLTPSDKPLRVSPGARSMTRFDKGALVLEFESDELTRRWRECQGAGASSNYPEYRPHVTITYENKDVDTAALRPFPGVMHFGPERFRPLDASPTERPMEKSMQPTAEQINSAVVVAIPAIIKARVDTGGRRIVEVEASSQEVDSEGDVILQSALLASAQEFVATGCLDIDHLSELGYQLGIPDPASYVVGRPLEVKNIGDGRTSVVGELRRALDGTHDPLKHKYDDLWDSLQSNPAVPWYASIYGFPLPGMMEDCAAKDACEHGARRFLIRGINWRSLAFTRRPVNQSLRGRARIISAKAAMREIAKSMSILEATPPIVPPRVDDIWAKRCCEKCGVDRMPTVAGYQDHFVKCCGMTEDMAELCAYAMMHKTNIERVFSA